MNAILEVVAIPLGFLLKLIFDLVQNYYIAIFLFVLLTRILLFPLSLKTQKGTADRARLAPRLEQIQKKYAKDQKKMQEKQMALYEKHGVSPTGGCMPMLIQMLVLFGIISVIYSPIKHITSIPNNVVDASVNAIVATGKVDEKQFAQGSYYRELRMMQNLKDFKEPVILAIGNIEENGTKLYTQAEAEAYYQEMVEFEGQFNFFGQNMLEQPWNEKKFAGINALWLIPLISGITALFSSLLSMHYTKQQMGGNQAQQQAQGCSNAMMFIMMPAMSLFIAFSVPGAVGIYWICSNLLALVQTFILNQIYNPAKIRAEAEKEYAERRRQKQEDKKRLAEARAREQRELAQQINEEKKSGGKKKKAEKPAEEAPVEEAAEEPAEESTENSEETEE